MKKTGIVTAVILALCLMTAGVTYAVPVYGTSVGQLSDYREGIYNLATSTSYEGLRITWNIEQVGGIWQYTYTFTGFTSPAISHFILDLTDDCVSGNSGCIRDPSYPYTGEGMMLDFNAFGASPGNPGFPETADDIIGVKFDETSGASGFLVYFESYRSPVWGDFYVKGASDQFAYNLGLTDHNADSTSLFIARPDGDTAVPEPTTMLLLGTGLVGLAGYGRRKLRK